MKSQERKHKNVNVTLLRYMLFYNDNYVSDSINMKSKIRFTSAEEYFFDM